MDFSGREERQKTVHHSRNDVSPCVLGVMSFDLSIPRPYKVLRNVAATARMTGGFVFVTWRHTEIGVERLAVKAEVHSWEMAGIG